MVSSPSPAGNADTPLLDALCAQAGEGRVSFHMPGHAGGRGFSSTLLGAAGRLDTTELVVTDDIHLPTGPARKAMEQAALAFGAGRTFFLTTGSTCGLLAMVTVATAGGRPLLLPRTVHRSVLHAIALTGAEYRFLPLPPLHSGRSPFAPAAQPRPQDIRDALASDPSIGAILVTSPDYYGLCADLPAIAEVAHQAGVLLLVDEAHGAHLRFAPDLLPLCAMDAGADLCVQSAHKTLPALTQAALLHLSADAIRRGVLHQEAIQDAINLYETSSPSFLIAASIDAAREWMERQGGERIHTLVKRIRSFGDSLPQGLRAVTSQVQPGDGLRQDPTRMVLDVSSTGIPGPVWLRALAEREIDIEMADLWRLVCIPALDSGPEDFIRLRTALADILEQYPDRKAQSTAAQIIAVSGQDLARAYAVPPERAAHPRRFLVEGERGEWTPLEESAGRVSTGSLVPYPPGIPLIWPGEIPDLDRIRLIRGLIASGIEVVGVRSVTRGCGHISPEGCEIRTIPAGSLSAGAVRNV